MTPSGTLDRLSRLENSFACCWASSRSEQEIKEFTEELGRGTSYPIIEFNQVIYKPSTTWKIESINHAVGASPCAWIDDEFYDDAYHWAEQRQAATLLLKTDPTIGLTNKEEQQLLQWNNSNRVERSLLNNGR